VTHCQSHHRSSLSWLVMELLGYRHPRGYHGSWGEWGNRDDTPVESD
jgi:thiosulfate/3-mercaptopyruvate sulfurtransferase